MDALYFPFRFDPMFRLVDAALGVRPDTCGVQIVDDRVLGPVRSRVEPPGNVAEA